jgi:hypothetical protein
MRVKVRITRPRRAVAEPGSHKPLGDDAFGPGFAPPGSGGHILEHPEGSGHRGVVGVAHLVRRLRITEGEEQGDALGSTEGGVEPGNLRRTLRPSQPCPGLRVTVIQDTVQRLRVNLTGQSEPAGAAAHPLPGGFPGAGVVLLQAVGHHRQVVVRIPEFPEAQHRSASALRFPFRPDSSPAPFPATLTGPRRTPGASASG